MIALRRYDDGWWFRIGHLSIGRDAPEWHLWRSLPEREGWQRRWRRNGYSVTWNTRRWR